MFPQTQIKPVLFRRAVTQVVMGLFCMVLIAVSLLIIVSPATSSAATNSTLNFQARLEGPSGNIAPDGNYNVQFKIYSVSSGGSEVWGETYQNSNGQGVVVSNGYISVPLGSLYAFSNANINWNEELWLTMNIGGTSSSASPAYDGEMNPRLKLTGVPYAFRAGALATTNGTYTSTLSLAVPTGGNQIFTIPNQGAAGTYTLLTQNTANTNFIQNQNASSQGASNYWISGTGRADTALQAPALDTATSAALSIGGTNASSIIIGKAGSNIATTVSGTAIFKPSVANESATAFQIQDAAGTAYLIADSTKQAITVKDMNIGSALNIGTSGRLFSDGFESGNFAQWNTGVTTGGSSTVTIDTTMPRGGKYSTKLTNNNGVGHVRAPISGVTTTIVRGYVYISSNTMGNVDLISLVNGSSQAFTLFRDNATGRLNVWNAVAGGPIVGSSVMTLNTWHEIELELTVNASTGIIKAYLDGSNVINSTNQNTGSSNPVSLMVGDTNITHVYTAYVDDIVVDTVRPGSSSSLYVADSFHVSGTSSFGGKVLIQNSTDSTSAFRVQNAAGSNLINVDSTNNLTTVSSSLSLGSSFNQTYGDFTVHSTAGIMQLSTAAYQLHGGISPLIFATNNTATNLIYPNAGFEGGTAYWGNSGSGTGLGISSNGVPIYSPGTTTIPNTYDGRYSLGVVTASGTANTGVKTTNFAAALSSATQYTLSFYAKANGTAFTTLRAGMAYNGSSETACSLSTTSVSTSGFQRYSCTFTTGTISGSPYIFIGVSDTTQRSFYLDNVQLQQAGSVKPFDSGIMMIQAPVTNPVTFMNGSDSTTAFQIQNSAGTSNLFVADTLNNQLNVGGGLSVAGGAQFSDWVSANGLYTPRIERGDGTGTQISFGTNQAAVLRVANNVTTTVTQINRANSGQTADLIQLQDSNSNINASFNATGNRLTLGRIAGSGTVIQGSLVLGDGTTNNFGATLNTTTLTANRTIYLPNETGTLCIQSSTNCGFAVGSAANYIQNQNAAAQASSNIWISGTARADRIGVGAAPTLGRLELQGNLLDVAGSGGLVVLNVATSSTNVQSGVRSILEVAPATASSMPYYGSYSAISSSSLNIAAASLTGVYGGVSVGGISTVANAYGGVFGVGNGPGSTITNTYGTFVQNPSNVGTINTNYGVYIQNQTSGATDYGLYVQGGDTNAIYVESGNSYFGGDITVLGNSLLRSTTNSATAVQIQNAAGSNLFVVDASTMSIKIGGGEVGVNSTPTLLILDHKSDAGDPTGTNGGVYYNANTKKLRCYQNSEWVDCTEGSNTVRKTANQTATSNSGVMQNVTDMAFPVAVSSTYSFEVTFLINVGNTSADYKYTLTTPTGATINALGTSPLTIAAGTSYACVINVSAGNCGIDTISTGPMLTTIKGIITTDATNSGNVQLQFAQNTPTVTASPTALANSMIKYHRLY